MGSGSRIALNESYVYGGNMDFDIAQIKQDQYEFVRTLRNDKETKRGFISQEYISKEQQEKYMTEHGQNYFICFADGQPAGYVGVVDSDIRVAVHPNYLNLGVGEFMIRYIMDRFPDARARIKNGNLASKKLFEKCGYVPEFLIYKNPSGAR
jgi:GNAT superfamily N-acetyltransferase